MTTDTTGYAPGHPGIAPTWTSSAKDLVGTSLGSSRLWFTIGFGIINEVFYPHVDIPQIRDLGFIVADGKGFWCEVKRLRDYVIKTPAPGIPAVTIIHEHERFTLTLRVSPDPERDVLLIDAQLTGDGMRLYALLAPHLADSGSENVATKAQHGPWSALCAQHGDVATALLAVDAEGNDAWSRLSCGYVGTSDGWQDFDRHGAMTWTYATAGPGNVALTGELPMRATLALGFGGSPSGAATLAAAALTAPFEVAWQRQTEDWRAWHAAMDHGEFETYLDADLLALAAVSASVLKTHQDKVFKGATVASLSTPWGQSHDDSGGYHLVWMRDLTETAVGLLAIGAIEDTRNILRYVIATQCFDGRWAQNQWLSGEPFWKGVQLDEAAFPIVLAAILSDREALGDIDVAPMVRRAATFVARNGPVTEQDRWEENTGVSPFTIAIAIAALVCAAEFLDEPARSYALELADTWNERIERWTYAQGTPLAQRLGVDGYFIRIAPPEVLNGRDALNDSIRIANREAPNDRAPACEVIGLEFLQLVRMGLRRDDHPCIRSSVKVADEILRVETPSGPLWRRYNGDGYGEHEDGSAFDGFGIGRPWPLLAGERGWYAGACGEDTLPYLHTMRRTTSRGGMIPEQVWDAPAIPEEELYPGRPTGGAMPLVWAHAEFLKLCGSVGHHRSFDSPSPVWKRYDGHASVTTLEPWRLGGSTPIMQRGRTLRIELLEAARVRYSFDDWQTNHEMQTLDTGLGVFIADIPTTDLPVGAGVIFTWHWTDREVPQGEDYTVTIAPERSFLRVPDRAP